MGEGIGSLGAQLGKLEAAEYLAVRKEFKDHKPVSWYALMDKGRSALEAHFRALKSAKI